MTDSPTGARAANEPWVGRQQRVGSFRYLVATDEWTWSDAVARMHGYEPGTVHPTAKLILSHIYSDDLLQVAEMLEARRTGVRPFSNRHRIVDTEGNIKQVVMVGDELLDDSGTVLGTSGFYVDLVESYAEDIREDVDDAVDEAVSALTSSRASIEQVKGVLMLAYGVSADHAFGILAWRSQESNTKLRVLAQQIIDAVADGSGPTVPDTWRNELDHFIMTVDRRIPPEDRAAPRAESATATQAQKTQANG